MSRLHGLPQVQTVWEVPEVADPEGPEAPDLAAEEAVVVSCR